MFSFLGTTNTTTNTNPQYFDLSDYDYYRASQTVAELQDWKFHNPGPGKVVPEKYRNFRKEDGTVFWFADPLDLTVILYHYRRLETGDIRLMTNVNKPLELLRRSYVLYCLLHSHIRTLALLLPRPAYSHALLFLSPRETEIPKQLLLDFLVRHRGHPVDVVTAEMAFREAILNDAGLFFERNPRIMEEVQQEIQRRGTPLKSRAVFNQENLEKLLGLVSSVEKLERDQTQLLQRQSINQTELVRPPTSFLKSS